MSLNAKKNPDKILNRHLARGVARAKGAGSFKAIVSLAEPDYRPSYMRIGAMFSPGFFHASLPFEAMERALADRHILSVELREHMSAPA